MTTYFILVRCVLQISVELVPWYKERLEESFIFARPLLGLELELEISVHGQKHGVFVTSGCVRNM